jgi:hypothetical protein
MLYTLNVRIYRTTLPYMLGRSQCGRNFNVVNRNYAQELYNYEK